MTFPDFRAILAAIKAGELDPATVEIQIDNDNCPVKVDCEPYRNEYGEDVRWRPLLPESPHPADVLEALLEHVGIRWRDA